MRAYGSLTPSPSGHGWRRSAPYGLTMAPGWSIRRTLAYWLPVVLLFATLSHIPWLYHRLYLGPAAPLAGKLQARVNFGLLAAVLCLAAILVRWAPCVAARLAWRPLLAVSSLAAATWASVLALNDGVLRTGRTCSRSVPGMERPAGDPKARRR